MPRRSKRPFGPKPEKPEGCNCYKVLETYRSRMGKGVGVPPVMDLLKNYFNMVNEDDERKRR